MAAIVVVCIFGSIFVLFGSCFVAFGEPIFVPTGIIFIVTGIAASITVIAVTIVLRQKKRKKNEERQKLIKKEKEDFDGWLSQNNFKTYTTLGDFLLDAENSKWCKYLNYKIFNISDIVKIKVQKHSSRTSVRFGTRNGSSSTKSKSWETNNIFFANTRKGKSNSNRTSTHNSGGVSMDTSNYDVHISTKLIEEPLIVIQCGTSSALADKICAAINIMLGIESN